MKKRLFLVVVCIGCITWLGCDPPEENRLNDPGTEPFVLVPENQVADECGLDPNLLKKADGIIDTGYIVVRYGKLCHQYLPSGADRPSAVYSTTKTLGAVVTGIASYETRNLPRTGPKTGPLSDTDRADHWIDDFRYNKDALVAHVLAMEAHNETLEDSEMVFYYDGFGDYALNTLSDMVNTAIAQDPDRLGRNLEQFTQRFLYKPLGMTGSTWSFGLANKNFGISWRATLHDMARLGLLILHGGMYNGKRLLDESWIYRMTHPSFESANTAYGYLTWLNTRGGGTSPLADIMGDPISEYDLCAPVPLWNSYPHYPSTSPDCNADPGYNCRQTYDVGAWAALGTGGQFIIGHPGLDLLIVAKNYVDPIDRVGPDDGIIEDQPVVLLDNERPNAFGPLWKTIRPALVALDPEYKGDEEAFCKAYGSNNYAPDLRWQPMP